jgi:hypothetical protein
MANKVICINLYLKNTVATLEISELVGETGGRNGRTEHWWLELLSDRIKNKDIFKTYSEQPLGT